MRGEHIFITGGSRGIGFELAHHWLLQGASVVTASRCGDYDDGMATLKACHGQRYEHLACNVADQASVERAAATVQRLLGQVDVLVNNAGISGNRSADVAAHKQLGRLEADRLMEVFRVNAIGPLLVTQAILPLMVGRPRPRVVMVSSSAASCAQRSTPGTYDYGASKAALNMIARNLAADLGEHGPVVACIDPGAVATDMTGGSGDSTPAQAADEIIDLVERMGGEYRGSFVDRRGQAVPW